MTFHRPGARVCARTGLVLVPSAGEPAYRVALSLYGPLNPPARGPVGADVSSWSRYDTYGRAHRVHRVHPGVRVR